MFEVRNEKFLVFPHVSTSECTQAKLVVGADRGGNPVKGKFVECDNEVSRYVLTGLNCSINVSFTL